MRMEKGKKTSESFEQALARLESIVSQLESGELPLDKSLAIFEEGVGLARVCQKHLAEAERKVELLVKERGELKLVPFDGGSQTDRAGALDIDDDDGDGDDEDDEDDDGMPF